MLSRCSQNLLEMFCRLSLAFSDWQQLLAFHFWAALCYRTVVLFVLSVCLSLRDVGYCGQAVGWIKIEHGMEVSLGPGDIVLDGTMLPQKGHSSPRPTFRPMSIVAKGLDGSRCHLLRR